MGDKDQKYCVRLTPEEDRTIRELADKQGLSIKKTILRVIKGLYEEKKYEEFMEKTNFDERIRAALHDILSELAEEINGLKDEIDELKGELQYITGSVVTEEGESIVNFDDIVKSGVEGRIIDNVNTMVPVDDKDVGVEVGASSEDYEKVMPRDTMPQPAPSKNVFEVSGEELKNGYFKVLGGMENAGHEVRFTPATAPAGPRQQPQQNPAHIINRVREQFNSQERKEESQPAPAGQPTPSKAPAVYYDPTRDPPYVAGVNVKMIVDPVVIYTDGSIWNKLKKEWTKVGPIVGKILKMEGLR